MELNTIIYVIAGLIYTISHSKQVDEHTQALQLYEKDKDADMIEALVHLASILLWPLFLSFDIRFWFGKQLVMRQLRREARSAQIFFAKYKKWAHDTFGTDDPIHGLTKLQGELNEAKQSPHDIAEYADMLMCMMYAYSCAFPDKSFDELLQAANEKLAINMRRKWQKMPDGTFQHIKE